MAPTMTNTLTATITGTEDATGNVPINRGLGNLAFDGVQFSDFTTYQNLAAGDTVITIPGAKAYQIYVKNLNSGSLNVVVKYTPTGLAQQVSTTLGPGEVFLIWSQVSNSAPNAAITALTLNASGANCPVEYFLGGA